MIPQLRAFMRLVHFHHDIVVDRDRGNFSPCRNSRSCPHTMVRVLSSTLPHAIPQLQVVMPLVNFHNGVAINIAPGQATDVVLVAFAPMDRPRAVGSTTPTWYPQIRANVGLVNFDNGVQFRFGKSNAWNFSAIKFFAFIPVDNPSRAIQNPNVVPTNPRHRGTGASQRQYRLVWRRLGFCLYRRN